ncbi:MAG: SatD family protein [Caldanaerobacter sp.]|uniref:SatD family protein n=1 Tax=Caldanaerobacter sp. TaxID=2930036 RepID=UPI003C7921DA
MYFVITADIVKSRELLKKGIKREFFLEAVNQANDLCSGSLFVPFSLMRGDEIQGIVADGDSLPKVVRKLRFSFLPAVLRIGIGIGEISTEVKSTSWEMDGEAFYRAREALTSCGDNVLTVVKMGAPFLENIVTALFTLIDALESKWTMGQWEAVIAYEIYGTYHKAAEILKVAPQNVSKRCHAAKWPAVVEGEKAIISLLKFGLEGEKDG